MSLRQMLTSRSRLGSRKVLNEALSALLVVNNPCLPLSFNSARQVAPGAAACKAERHHVRRSS